MPRFRTFLRDQQGATVIDYAMVLVLISAVVIVTMRWIGANVIESFQMIPSHMDSGQQQAVESSSSYGSGR